MILFIKKLRNKATSNIKIQQVFPILSLDDVGIYLRDGPFESDIVIVNLHPTEGTHWIAYKKEKFFGSSGCAPPIKLSKFILKRNRFWLYSEYKIQGLANEKDCFCASYCLYIIHLTNVIGIDFRSAVLILYFQMI